MTVAVDVDELKQALARMETINQSTDVLAKEFQYFIINHEQLVANRQDSLKKIFGFLGVDESEAEKIEPGTARQNPEKISVLVENYDEVRSALKNTRYERFLED